MKTPTTKNHSTTSKSGVRDSRTLLPDRDRFYHDVEPLLTSVERRSLTLLVVDLDGLDFILRTFGPEERDNAIREVGRRIQETTKADGTPYHITQDRFAVVLPDSSHAHSMRRSQALIEQLRTPLEISGSASQMDAFVGISHYPDHARSLGELVRAAVFACYQAREGQDRQATFDQTIDEQERHRFRLLVDLEQALESKTGIRLAYQPQIDLNSGDCVGVEGLCRWEHPTLGNIPPGHFLPFVEHTPLMLPLTEATLSLGLKDMAAWRSRGFPGSLAINLSPSLFRHPDILERLLAHFQTTGTAMEQVHFEVTETGMMDQTNQAVRILADIRQRGSRIAIDDFGTGHSSLAYLADLPVDIIKIDKHFVQNLSKPWGEAIVSAAATLADKLGLSTIAEGIEDEYQLQQCRALGVTMGQGFHIAHPLFRQDLECWLDLEV